MIEVLAKLREMMNGNIKTKELMSNHTSYGIGGPAEAFIEPTSIPDLQIAMNFAKEREIPVICVGSGSNILVSDDGIPGFVISLEKSFKEITFNDNICMANAGAKLGKVVKKCIKRNLSGLETLIGIPGTLGGAIIMNAGAFGSEISNCLTSVEILTESGKMERRSAGDIEFGYRSSSFDENDIVLTAELQLQEKSADKIRSKRDSANKQRKSTQPLKYRSAGSVFKNPEGGQSAGYLIDNAGLKGLRVGNAEVSKMHANFIINTGKATAVDMIDLINNIRETVFDKYMISLELEIRTIGFPRGIIDA